MLIWYIPSVFSLVLYPCCALESWGEGKRSSQEEIFLKFYFVSLNQPKPLVTQWLVVLTQYANHFLAIPLDSLTCYSFVPQGCLLPISSPFRFWPHTCHGKTYFLSFDRSVCLNTKDILIVWLLVPEPSCFCYIFILIQAAEYSHVRR